MQNSTSVNLPQNPKFIKREQRETIKSQQAEQLKLKEQQDF